MDFLTILPNLSIGVISVISLVYVTMKFLVRLEQKDAEFNIEIKERETAFRGLEKEVRTTLMKQVGENTRMMERVVDHFNGNKNHS